MTLVEVVIAITLLLAGTLATAAVADATSRASVGVAGLNTADGLARDALDAMRAAPYWAIGLDPSDSGFSEHDDGADSVAVVGSPFAVAETVVVAGRTFHLRRHITWASLSDLGAGPIDAAYKKLVVVVDWSADGGSHTLRVWGAATDSPTAAPCTQRWIDPDSVVATPVNGYLPGTSPVASGATVVSVGDLRDDAGRGVHPGDLLLVMQMEGPNAGRYEYAVAASALHEHQLAVTGRGPGGGLLNGYGPDPFQVVVVPTYRSVELATGFSASAWDGATGGVAAVDSVGSLTIRDTIEVDGRGLQTPRPPSFVESADSLLPGAGTPGAAGGALVMLRAGSVSGGVISAQGVAGGDGGAVVVVSERGDLATVDVGVAGGAAGEVLASATPHRVQPDSATVDSIRIGDLPGVGLGVGCLPAVTTWVRSLTNTAPADGVTTVRLAIDVRNESSVPSEAVVDVTGQLAAGFRYSLTQEVVLTAGATRTEVVDPVAGASAPQWGRFVLPAGGGVSIDFLATIDPGTAPGRVQSGAVVSVQSRGGASTSTYGSGFSADDDVEVTAP